MANEVRVPHEAPLTREELDQLRCDCGEEDCPGIVLHARCHGDAATWTVYDRRTGVLTVICGECSRPIADIAVAEARRQ